MDSIWIRYGASMDSIWIQYGLNMDTIWIQSEFNKDSMWIQCAAKTNSYDHRWSPDPAKLDLNEILALGKDPFLISDTCLGKQ